MNKAILYTIRFGLKTLSICIFVVQILAIKSEAKAPISGNLNASDQMKVGRILGFGSAIKVLGNPYPLGGYDGYEFGLLTGFISRDEMSRLGNGTGENSEISYLEFSIAKGLYQNLDVGIQFSLFPQTQSYSSFGAFGRLGLWEGEHYPASFSVQIHTNFANFFDLVNSTTGGIDGILSVNVDRITVFFGLGWLDTNASFIGGAAGVTSSGQSLTASNSSPRQFAGFSVAFGSAFAAFQADRAEEAYYSGKLGFRL